MCRIAFVDANKYTYTHTYICIYIYTMYNKIQEKSFDILDVNLYLLRSFCVFYCI